MKFFIPMALSITFISPVNAMDLGSVLKDQAAGSMKEQAVDKGIDMGADYAKGALKAEPSTSTEATVTDMAIKAAAESGMGDSAVDMGADYSKGAIKEMIK